MNDMQISAETVKGLELDHQRQKEKTAVHSLPISNEDIDGSELKLSIAPPISVTTVKLNMISAYIKSSPTGFDAQNNHVVITICNSCYR